MSQSFFFPGNSKANVVTSIDYFLKNVCMRNLEHILNQDENEANRITVMPKQIEAYNKLDFFFAFV